MPELPGRLGQYHKLIYGALGGVLGALIARWFDLPADMANDAAHGASVLLALAFVFLSPKNADAPQPGPSTLNAAPLATVLALALLLAGCSALQTAADTSADTPQAKARLGLCAVWGVTIDALADAREAQLLPDDVVSFVLEHRDRPNVLCGNKPDGGEYAEGEAPAHADRPGVSVLEAGNIIWQMVYRACSVDEGLTVEGEALCP